MATQSFTNTGGVNGGTGTGISLAQGTGQTNSITSVGGSSPITDSGNAMSTNTLDNSGGVTGAGTGAGISSSQSTSQTTSCTSAGGTSPISNSCSSTSTNTGSNSGGVNSP